MDAGLGQAPSSLGGRFDVLPTAQQLVAFLFLKPRWSTHNEPFYQSPQNRYLGR